MVPTKPSSLDAPLKLRRGGVGHGGGQRRERGEPVGMTPHGLREGVVGRPHQVGRDVGRHLLGAQVRQHLQGDPVLVHVGQAALAEVGQHVAGGRVRQPRLRAERGRPVRVERGGGGGAGLRDGRVEHVLLDRDEPHYRVPSTSATGTPPHHTAAMLPIAPMSCAGSPSMSTRSARLPGAMTPRSASPNCCAARTVADRSASNGGQARVDQQPQLVVEAGAVRRGRGRGRRLVGVGPGQDRDPRPVPPPDGLAGGVVGDRGDRGQPRDDRLHHRQGRHDDLTARPRRGAPRRPTAAGRSARG